MSVDLLGPLVSRDTLVLAPVLGIYLLASAVGFLRIPTAVADFSRNLCQHPAAMHAVGAVAWFVGASIVSFHRHWGNLAEISVTGTGVWWAFEGAGMLASPAAVARALQHPRYISTMRAMQWVALLAGGYLLSVGLLGRAA
ncbi:hypothetical protein [Sphingomonas sp. TDK1]|uniref:hypothetical protein n=1 Tax=Sphingomonas sp. TDK1 TaxID=453247 RepID=UPI0007D96FB7|nr:hypothetical protein [Sphingomonas sp. TDK1]OAN66091.1 hypothetical protein A7X12_11815 [Sphingomonas sp. TDK1]